MTRYLAELAMTGDANDAKPVSPYAHACLPSSGNCVICVISVTTRTKTYGQRPFWSMTHFRQRHHEKGNHMTNFLIADMIRQGDFHISGALGVELDKAGFSPDILTDAVFFDVNVASQLYWRGRNDFYSLEKDFGPIRPPYPDVWMEWDVPSRVQIAGKWADSNPTHWAALVRTREHNTAAVTPASVRKQFETLARSNLVEGAPPTDEDYTRLAAAFQAKSTDVVTVSVQMFLTRPDGLTASGQRGFVAVPMAKDIQVNPGTGHFVAKSAYDRVPNQLRGDPAAIKQLRALADANPVWMALQLINCRNVTTKQQGSVFTRSTAEKRRGTPVTKYHTIVLPGTETVRGQHGKRQGQQDILARHKVRGHFKTFTAERPLLGKHVGTYWWGWQIRGNAEHGTVVSDYKFQQQTVGSAR